MNTPEGLMTVGNGSQGYASTTLLAPVAVVGMLAAIAIPNFVKARATSQQNACINNLRQLDAAKNEWALEKAKKATDTPTKQDLLPFLRSWPVCPQGGNYTIGPVSEPPKCSITGHELP
jgi:type II secretory pathway pseudopilin PulG